MHFLCLRYTLGRPRVGSGCRVGQQQLIKGTPVWTDGLTSVRRHSSCPSKWKRGSSCARQPLRRTLGSLPFRLRASCLLLLCFILGSPTPQIFSLRAQITLLFKKKPSFCPTFACSLVLFIVKLAKEALFVNNLLKRHFS